MPARNVLLRALGLHALTAFGPSVAGAQDAVRLSVEGAAAAAASQQWRVFRRGATWVAERRIDHGAAFGARDAVGLMTDDDQRALLARLTALELFTRKPPKAPQPMEATRWTLVVEATGQPRQSLTVEAPELLEDRRFFEAIQAVTSVVESATPALPLRDLQAPVAQSGWLHLEAPAGTRIRVDGVGLHESTPIDALRLATGPHVIEVAFPPSEAMTSYDVRIEQGKATLLRVTAP